MDPQIAIIGAGPYGLSLAAHLRARGVSYRIFGSPMESWRTRMPAGMFLKSEGFASNLYDPDGAFTLKRFCEQNAIAYGDMGQPVPLGVLTAYGLAFQRRFVPEVEERRVVALERKAPGFVLRLDDGESVAARAVVVAVGLGYYHYIAENLAHLAPELLSHSSAHHQLDRFEGRDVTVVGAGASALDLAALLDQAGAAVRVVARRPVLDWTGKPLSLPRPLWQRIRYPLSGMSPGVRSRLYEDLPMLFRYLPRDTRLNIVRTFLGPAPPWWIRDQVVERVPLLLGCRIERAEAQGGRAMLALAAMDGSRQTVSTEHVIAATGFRVDLARLPFLAEDIRSKLKAIDRTPVLSPNFESSVPGLYFVGLPSTISFGPLMRFMLGARYTSRRLSSHLARFGARGWVSGGGAPVPEGARS